MSDSQETNSQAVSVPLVEQELIMLIASCDVTVRKLGAEQSQNGSSVAVDAARKSVMFVQLAQKLGGYQKTLAEKDEPKSEGVSPPKTAPKTAPKRAAAKK